MVPSLTTASCRGRESPADRLYARSLAGGDRSVKGRLSPVPCAAKPADTDVDSPWTADGGRGSRGSSTVWGSPWHAVAASAAGVRLVEVVQIVPDLSGWCGDMLGTERANGCARHRRVLAGWSPSDLSEFIPVLGRSTKRGRVIVALRAPLPGPRPAATEMAGTARGIRPLVEYLDRPDPHGPVLVRAVHHGMPLSATDQPAVDREGDDPSHRQ